MAVALDMLQLAGRLEEVGIGVAGVPAIRGMILTAAIALLRAFPHP